MLTFFCLAARISHCLNREFCYGEMCFSHFEIIVVRKLRKEDRAMVASASGSNDFVFAFAPTHTTPTHSMAHIHTQIHNNMYASNQSSGKVSCTIFSIKFLIKMFLSRFELLAKAETSKKIKMETINTANINFIYLFQICS